jgi:integrase
MPVELSNITAYAWNLKKNGRKDATIETVTHRLLLLAKHSNLADPESVKEALITIKWQNSTKATAVMDYTAYLRFLGKTWTKPKYIPQEKIYFIPTEQEIDTLIAASCPNLAALLQFLKETAVRIGEACQVQWADLDYQNHTAAINHPEKGSLPRLQRMSDKLIAMLNQLPKTQKPVFLATSSQQGIRKTFESMRQRTAEKLQNPRLLRIHCHTFRHWKATTMMMKGTDSYFIRQLLGHKTATMTDRYINIVKSLLGNGDEQYICKCVEATDKIGIMRLIEDAYTKADEADGIHFYRKRK